MDVCRDVKENARLIFLKNFDSQYMALNCAALADEVDDPRYLVAKSLSSTCELYGRSQGDIEEERTKPKT